MCAAVNAQLHCSDHHTAHHSTPHRTASQPSDLPLELPSSSRLLRLAPRSNHSRSDVTIWPSQAQPHSTAYDSHNSPHTAQQPRCLDPLPFSLLLRLLLLRLQGCHRLGAFSGSASIVFGSFTLHHACSLCTAAPSLYSSPVSHLLAALPCRLMERAGISHRCVLLLCVVQPLSGLALSVLATWAFTWRTTC